MGQVKYKTREFSSEFLLDTVLNDDEIVVENKAVDSSKWGTQHKLIFKHEGKLYLWYYETVPQDGIQIHYALDLSVVNDTTLRSLLTGLNKFRTPSPIGNKSYKIKDSVRLLVIEDIDAIFDQRENKVPDSKLTFSGLLNVLDGLNSTAGLITIITTNHIDKLDPALLRSGRIDKVIKLDLPTDDLIREMIGRFLDNKDEQEVVFNEVKSEGLTSMAQIQDKLVKRIL